MALNSITFLFWFLPVFLIAYFLCKLRFRQALLLLASLFVYSWGNSVSLIFLICFIILNYVMGLAVEKRANILPLAVVLDAAFLLMFKFGCVWIEDGVAFGMPLGISFYTLSGISYLVDVSRGKAAPSRNIMKFALYIAMLPKITMGPVVQYADIDDQLDWPSINSDMVADGMFRFSIGLGKKLIIAGRLAEMQSYCWGDAELSVASAWLGLIAFSLQLYYDFSGYSDMATGLAQMLGFEFKENFIYPYASGSLAEFWRRWHASLGAWFREYVYIPLGGNRSGNVYFNMFAVWLLTGLWHGLGGNYIAWGMFLFVFAAIERAVKTRAKAIREKFAEEAEGGADGSSAAGVKRSLGFLDPDYADLWRVFGIFYTDVIVVAGWVFFNAGSFAGALDYFSYLFGGSAAMSSAVSKIYFDANLPLILVAIVGATPFPRICARQILGDGECGAVTVIKVVFMLALLVVSTLFMVNSGYTPFIYQNF